MMLEIIKLFLVIFTIPFQSVYGKSLFVNISPETIETEYTSLSSSRLSRAANYWKVSDLGQSQTASSSTGSSVSGSTDDSKSNPGLTASMNITADYSWV